MNEPIIVLTCDNVVNLNLKNRKRLFKKNSPYCMLIPVYPIKNLDGDYIAHQNNIVSSLSRKKNKRFIALVYKS